MKKTDWKYLVDVLMFLSMIGIILIGLLLAFILKEGPAIKESDKFFLGLHRHQWTHIHLYLSLAFAITLAFHLILEWSWIKGKSRMLFRGAWRHALGLIVTGAVLLPFAFWAFLPKNAPEYYEFGFGRGQGRGQPNLAEGGRRLPARIEAPGRTADPSAESRDRGEPLGTLKSREVSQPAASAEIEEPHAGEKTAREQGHEAKLVSGRLETDQASFVITGRMTLRQVEAETGITAGRILTQMGLPGNLARDEALGRLRRRHGFTLVELRTAVEALMEKK
jgi:uncharacterized membrane protein YedE/YeeE